MYPAPFQRGVFLIEWAKSPLSGAKDSIWSHRLTVRTPGFHPGNPGSIPGEITTIDTANKDLLCEVGPIFILICWSKWSFNLSCGIDLFK